MSFEERVYQVLKQIPQGRVATYKSVAQRLGTNAYRAVGTACKNNPNAPIVPCHSVVKSDGGIGGYMGKMYSPKKEALLRKECVLVSNGRIVDFEKRLWKKSS